MELNFGGLGLVGEAREGRRLLLGRAWGKPARGCGDYSWRTSAEAREGLRRLLLEEACGSSRSGAKAAKWRKLAAKLGAKTAKWRELAAKQLVAVSGS